jgi:hypothetical protein
MTTTKVSPKKENSGPVPIMIMVQPEIAKMLSKISREHGRSRSSHLSRVLEKYCSGKEGFLEVK